jgi:hypothetical protein
VAAADFGGGGLGGAGFAGVVVAAGVGAGFRAPINFPGGDVGVATGVVAVAAGGAGFAGVDAGAGLTNAGAGFTALVGDTTPAGGFTAGGLPTPVGDSGAEAGAGFTATGVGFAVTGTGAGFTAGGLPTPVGDSGASVGVGAVVGVVVGEVGELETVAPRKVLGITGGLGLAGVSVASCAAGTAEVSLVIAGGLGEDTDAERVVGRGGRGGPDAARCMGCSVEGVGAGAAVGGADSVRWREEGGESERVRVPRRVLGGGAGLGTNLV